MGVIAPWARTPKNVALDYNVGKISASCLGIAIVVVDIDAVHSY